MKFTGGQTVKTGNGIHWIVRDVKFVNGEGWHYACQEVGGQGAIKIIPEPLLKSVKQWQALAGVGPDEIRWVTDNGHIWSKPCQGPCCEGKNGHWEIFKE